MTKSAAEKYVRDCGENDGPDSYEEAAEVFAALYDCAPATDLAAVIDAETEKDGCAGYRVFRGVDSNQLTPDGQKLDPHAWFFEPEDYEGDVIFARGFATQPEAVEAARNYDADLEVSS